MVSQRQPILLPSLVALAVATAVQTPRAARADEPRPPPPPPPYVVQPAQPPVYIAPLSQTTQTTYVPQSVALSGPEEIDDYDEMRPPPLGYTPVAKTRYGLIIGGACTFGSTYLLAAFIASVGQDVTERGGENKVGALWVPVAGPFIEMGQTSSATARFFLASLGAAETAGAIMLLYGMTTPRHILVRNDLLGMTISPMVGRGASGMMVSGRF